VVALLSSGTIVLLASFDVVFDETVFGGLRGGVVGGEASADVESTRPVFISSEVVLFDRSLSFDCVSVNRLISTAVIQNSPAPPNHPKFIGDLGADVPPPPSSVGRSISSCASMRDHIASSISGSGNASSLLVIVISYACLLFILF